jgi:hypothetical protein
MIAERCKAFTSEADFTKLRVELSKGGALSKEHADLLLTEFQAFQNRKESSNGK